MLSDLGKSIISFPERGSIGVLRGVRVGEVDGVGILPPVKMLVPLKVVVVVPECGVTFQLKAHDLKMALHVNILGVSFKRFIR